MAEGFWLVQFEGMQGSGGGVVFLSKGHLMGGDSGYSYMGTYKIHEDKIYARVSIHNFLPGVPNVLGIQQDFELQFEAAVGDEVMKGTASLIRPAGIGIAIKLTKKANLP